MICGSSFKRHGYKVHAGYNKFCSRKCMGIWETNFKPRIFSGARVTYDCVVCGKSVTKLKCAAKNAQYCSVRCGNIRKHFNLVNRRGKETDIERRLSQILSDLGITHSKQKEIPQVSVADVFVEPNFLIYADGDYWHSKPDKVKKDMKQTTELSALGYNVSRFWGSDIMKRPQMVAAKLATTLKGEHHAGCQ